MLRVPAMACVIERLEARRLLASSVGIDSQPAGFPASAGYLVDNGAAPGAHGNGNAGGGSSTPAIASAMAPSSKPAAKATYVVSAAGSDEASGSSAAPFRSVSKALSVAQPGDTILVKSGTYHERIEPARSGSSGKPITLRGESTAGVVLDGTGLSRVITANGKSYITIRNLTVRNCANDPFNSSAAVGVGDNWTLRDVVVEQADGTGISVNGANVTLTRVIAQDNGVAGIGGTYASKALVKDCVVRRNNNGLVDPSWKSDPNAIQVNGLWYMDPDHEAGGGKWWASEHVTIDGLEAYDNTGPGIWFDWNSSDVRIRNSAMRDNHGLPGSRNDYQGDGIRVELQKDGPWVIEKNTIRDNTGAGIALLQDRNVTIRRNTLADNDIRLRDWYRDADHTMQNIQVIGNFLKNARIVTQEGTWTTTSGRDKQIVTNGNTYDHGDTVLMSWADKDYISLEAIRSTLGFEAKGRRGSVTVHR